MIKAALLVLLKAKPGKEDAVASFLESARSVVEQEEGTRAWFAIRVDASTFGVFDVFPDDAARQTHLAGGVGQALAERGEELFSEPPSIQNLDVLASKLPGEAP